MSRTTGSIPRHTDYWLAGRHGERYCNVALTLAGSLRVRNEVPI